jgi:hypothetical protein
MTQNQRLGPQARALPLQEGSRRHSSEQLEGARKVSNGHFEKVSEIIDLLNPSLAGSSGLMI